MTTLDSRRNGAPMLGDNDIEPQSVNDLASFGGGGDGVQPRSGWRGWRSPLGGADEAEGRPADAASCSQESPWGGGADGGDRGGQLRVVVYLAADLAAVSAWAGWPSWLWPLIIDGTIILATLGIVSLAPYRDQVVESNLSVGGA